DDANGIWFSNSVGEGHAYAAGRASAMDLEHENVIAIFKVRSSSHSFIIPSPDTYVQVYKTEILKVSHVKPQEVVGLFVSFVPPGWKYLQEPVWRYLSIGADHQVDVFEATFRDDDNQGQMLVGVEIGRLFVDEHHRYQTDVSRSTLENSRFMRKLKEQ